VNNFAARLTAPVLLLGILAGCTDTPVQQTPVDPDPTTPAPLPVGMYEFTLTGLDGSDPEGHSASRAEEIGPEGANLALSPTTSGLAYEVLSSSSVTEGPRGQDGHRYVSVTYRVRNMTGAPISNLTLIPAIRTTTISGTAFTSLLRFDGSPASASLAPSFVPTGAVYIRGGEMLATTPDVLQVFTEAEIATVPLPAGTTSLLPYGFVVRNATNPNSRTIPNTSDPNEWGGALTFAFRYPLQGTAAADPFSISFAAMAVQDTETRLTESMEEAQDTAAVRRLRSLATALSATTVTILAGSNRQLPSDPDYPGQRLICNPRTAGTAASPVTFMRNPAAYTLLKLYMPGEVGHGCEADFRSGTPGRPATNVPFTVQVRAYDRYGNVRTAVVDTVRLRTAPGSPPATVGPALPLGSGARNLDVTFTDYGNATLGAVGRRNFGWHAVPVAGVTRTWTAGAGTTSWHTNGNWSPAAVPMSLDSVLIPTTPSGGAIFPVLSSNVSIRGVNVESGATISLGAFDLTAGANVATTTSGGINGSVGRVILTGIAATVRGNLPRIRVTGTYSLDGNVTATAPIRVESGRLRNASFRIRGISQ
jgi:hypothetical protein